MEGSCRQGALLSDRDWGMLRERAVLRRDGYMEVAQDMIVKHLSGGIQIRV